MKTLEFWCELASPYTYLAAARVDPLAAAAGVTVRWRPFSLGPIFQASGWTTSPFNVYPDKGRYSWIDLAREAKRYGLPFVKPSVFPKNPLTASKLALVGLAEGRTWGGPFLQRVLLASFAEDRDIASNEVLDELPVAGGQDPTTVRAEMERPEMRGLLRASIEEAVRRHVFGAPTFFAGPEHEEMFWGNDRLEQAIAAASDA